MAIFKNSCHKMFCESDYSVNTNKCQRQLCHKWCSERPHHRTVLKGEINEIKHKGNKIKPDIYCIYIYTVKSEFAK